MMDMNPPQSDAGKTVQRTEPEVVEQRRALVKQKTKEIRAAREHWNKKVFKRMREDMAFVSGEQWPNDPEEERYVLNICLRHVNHRVSKLYAKNPRVVAKRRERLDFQIWDENPQTLQDAMLAMTEATALGAPVGADPQAVLSQSNPQAAALLADVSQGMAHRQMVDRLGKTLEILAHYYNDEQHLKARAKQLVRRVLTTGVGYIWQDFQRDLDWKPQTVRAMEDDRERVATLQRMLEDAADGEMPEASAELEELKLSLQRMEAEPDLIVREGPTLDFPKSTSVIVDPKCTQLKELVGARWIAREFVYTREEIQELFGVDVGTTYKAYSSTGNEDDQTAKPAWADPWREGYESGKWDGPRGRYQECLVWNLLEKKTGLQLWICDGYPDFLEEPAAPNVKIEQFWPLYVLTFNDIEREGEIFPPSDVRLIRHPQREYNRSKDGLREHRAHSRPFYVTTAPAIEQQDRDNLKNRIPFSLVELKGLPPNTKVEDIITAFKAAPIDPNTYEVEGHFQDIQRAGGSQEANIGGTSGDTAYEVGIAESSKVSSEESNIDDLDMVLSAMERGKGQIMLQELSAETVKKIVGPGAIWPELARQDIEEELFLETVAGSNGRPNRVQELANLERIVPLLLQVPGISPQWLAKQLIERLDDRLDLTEAYVEGLPSIQALNALAGRPQQMGEPGVNTGNSENDPAQQGDEGGNNAPATDTVTPQAQPGFEATVQ